MTTNHSISYRSGYAAGLAGKSSDINPLWPWDGHPYTQWMAGYLAGRDARAAQRAA